LLGRTLDLLVRLSGDLASTSARGNLLLPARQPLISPFSSKAFRGPVLIGMVFGSLISLIEGILIRLVHSVIILRRRRESIGFLGLIELALIHLLG